jgi:hypothetical protein
MIRPWTFSTLALAAIWSVVGTAADMRPVDFDRDVRPILAGRCFKCHGAGHSEAGLRLNARETALAALESGNHAVVPGRPEESELARRVTAESADERMPPDEPLEPEQIETLRRWITEGADWPAHWAYRPLERPAVPGIGDPELSAWCRTEIDHFIVAKFVERGLTPTAEADRRTLLRRVSFDLSGLPPTADEYTAFCADETPDAWERVVERLLDSPRYGERWARHWMDLVHYAESHGQDQDRPREHAWPYRDYLIRSFNADKPYGQFVAEQVAGDVLFPDNPWAIVATGFLATGPWDESSLRDIREDAIDREIARYLDRDDIVTTVMSTFTSSTVNCARCHDHKFDPISQQDYYALQAVFAGTDKANRAYDPDPDVARRREELQAKLARVKEQFTSRDPQLLTACNADELAAWEAALAAELGMWQPVELVSAESGGGATLKPLEDRSLLAEGPRPDKDVYTLVVRPGLKRLTGLRIELLAHESLPMKGPGRQQNGNLHLNEIAAWVATDKHPDIGRRLTLQNPLADFDQEGWGVAKALDGNPNSAWGIFPAVGQDHQASFEVAQPIDLEDDSLLRIELQQIHGAGHLIGRLRITATDQAGPFPRQATTAPSNVREALAVAKEARSLERQIDVAGYYLEQRIGEEIKGIPEPSLVYCGTNQFAADGTFRPAAAPREVRVLGRGNIHSPGDVAEPGALGCIDGLPARFEIGDLQSEGERRADLAEWLVDRRNALVWRSIANRVWQHHFGRGLVDTPNDFGQMGSAPTHPELLDWLAVELLEHGGSLKHLHRLICASAAYRQGSGEHERSVLDAGNLYLSRMNRRRLDAEEVRDAALCQAGTLNDQMEGPSVRQFIQTPGIHVTPNIDYLGFDVDAPQNYRRSVYRFVFRTLPDPFMEALDCPDASQLAPERTESVTALQALATLNDKLIARQSERVAERIQAAGGTSEEQVRALYGLIFARAPDDAELAAVAEYVRRHGIANACRFLWNTNEFMFVD